MEAASEVIVVDTERLEVGGRGSRPYRGSRTVLGRRVRERDGGCWLGRITGEQSSKYVDMES